MPAIDKESKEEESSEDNISFELASWDEFTGLKYSELYSMQIFNHYITLHRSKASSDLWIGNLTDFRKFFTTDNNDYELMETLSTCGDISTKTTIRQ